jgi:hypothetical protein
MRYAYEIPDLQLSVADVQPGNLYFIVGFGAT